MKHKFFLVATTAFLAMILCGCQEQIVRDPDLFQLRLASDDAQEGWIEVKVTDVPNPVYVSSVIVATAADIKKAYVAKIRSQTGDPIMYAGKQVTKGIAVEFTSRASKRIEALTREHNGERLAILIANQVVYAPPITQPLKDRMLFYGNLSEEDCETVVNLLNGN